MGSDLISFPLKSSIVFRLPDDHVIGLRATEVVLGDAVATGPLEGVDTHMLLAPGWATAGPGVVPGPGDTDVGR